MLDTLAKESAKAREMGLSYGEYKALTYTPVQFTPSKPTRPKKRKKRYSDQEVFSLWQQGKNDAQIALSLGISRTFIQRWRSTLELPSNRKNPIDTKRYRLIETEDGIFAIYE